MRRTTGCATQTMERMKTRAHYAVTALTRAFSKPHSWLITGEYYDGGLPDRGGSAPRCRWYMVITPFSPATKLNRLFIRSLVSSMIFLWMGSFRLASWGGLEGFEIQVDRPTTPVVTYGTMGTNHSVREHGAGASNHNNTNTGTTTTVVYVASRACSQTRVIMHSDCSTSCHP